MTFSSIDIKAVIFDMDGLLLDTERLSLSTFIQACEHCGCEPNREVYLECIGSNREKTRQILVEGHGENFPLDAVCDVWDKNYRRVTLEQPIPVKAGAKDLLAFLSGTQVKIGLATSTKQSAAVKKLLNAGIEHYFEFILGGDQVSQGKPHPEIYRKVAAQFGVSAENCLAFEDSNTGVKAAYYAGMNVIQVPDLLEPSAEVKAFNHLIVSSLDEGLQLLHDRSSFSLLSSEKIEVIRC